MKLPKSINPKGAKIGCFILFLLCSLFIYIFSSDSRVDVLACTGNYYYTRQQIFSIANINANSRTILNPFFVIEQRLTRNPLIEGATVSYVDGGISINVEEKTVLGYFIEEDNTYLLCTDGQTIPINDLPVVNSLADIPQLAGFSRKQMEKIAAEFNKYYDYITRETISKIAEMVPWEESYDSSMIKMTMQDGNVVISSISDLLMISKYQLLLTRLQGDHVCLFLDKEHSAIDKISCSYIYMSSEERDEYRRELKEELERIQKEAEAAAKAAQEEIDRLEEETEDEQEVPEESQETEEEYIEDDYDYEYPDDEYYEDFVEEDYQDEYYEPVYEDEYYEDESYPEQYVEEEYYE